MATTKPERRRAAGFVRAKGSAIALLSIGGLAHGATSPSVQPTIAVSAVATDNAELTTGDLKRSDLIGDVDAGVIVHSRGSHLTITGNAGLDFIGYARNTEPSRVLPRGELDLDATLLEHALFFDGALSASRTRSDPLAPQSADTPSTANTVSAVSLRASPYYAHDFSPLLSASARSDTVVTRNHADDTGSGPAPDGSTYQHDVVNVTRKAAPFGFSIDGLHEDTRYQDSNASVLRNDALRATLTAAAGYDVVVGAGAGYERAEFSDQYHDDTTYGATLQWHPSSRTAFDVAAEHHYFGTGWNLHFRDRMPLTTVDLALTRTASANAASFGVSGPDSDPAALLGALLSSRTTDTGAIDDRAVDDLVQTRNLPTSFSQPLQITSESPQLTTRGTLNLIYNGLRDTIFASAWYQKAVALPDAAPTPDSTTFDSRQWGGSLGLYHRMTPQMSAAAQVDWSRIDALGTREGDSQRQVAATLSLTQRLGPRTTLSAGLRHFQSHAVLNSTSTTTEVRENQAFAGLRVQY